MSTKPAGTGTDPNEGRTVPSVSPPRPPDKVQPSFDHKAKEVGPLPCTLVPVAPDRTHPAFSPTPQEPSPAKAVSENSATTQTRTNAAIKVATPSTVSPNMKI